MRFGKAAQRSLLAALALIAVSASADARDLTIGIRAQHQSLDPHWTTSPAPHQINALIYEPLIYRNEDGKLEPLLAVSWERSDDVTWIFRLRTDVKWQDGKPFTADDAAFSLLRVSNVPGSTGSYKVYGASIAKTEAVDTHTLRVTTHGPTPDLLDKLAYIPLISKHIGGTATVADYNGGKAAVGTGPYKVVSWDQNAKTVLTRNSDYWGKKPVWDNVTYRLIESDASRLASFLSGEIDIMQGVPSREIEKLRKDRPAVHIWRKPTVRPVYVMLSPSKALSSGKVTAVDGSKLDKNPLEDPDVRLAMSLAIDRAGVAAKFYEGQAEATGQFLRSPDHEGYNPLIAVPKYDANQAIELLKKAGWHNKFAVTLTAAPNYGFENPVGVAETIAQLWSRIGIPAKVESIPFVIYVRTGQEGKLAAGLEYYPIANAAPSPFFPTVAHTTTGSWGTLNRAGYSNPKVDALLEQAAVTMDDAKRNAMYQEVSKLVVADNYLIPLFQLNTTDASQKEIGYASRIDVQMRATSAWLIDEKNPASGAKK